MSQRQHPVCDGNDHFVVVCDSEVTKEPIPYETPSLRTPRLCLFRVKDGRFLNVDTV